MKYYSRNNCFNLFILFFLISNFSAVYSTENNNDKPTAILKNPTNPGFGAVLHSVLSALYLYDEGHFSGIEINLDSGIYLDPDRGPNWWEYFFEPICIKGSEEIYVFSQHDVSDLINKGFRIPREKAFELIQKYIHLKPHIQNKLNDFIQTYFNTYTIIGIHYRGTDKVLETPLVPYESACANLNWWSVNAANSRIFIATDDQIFLDYVYHFFPANKIICNSFVRSQTNKPIHYDDSLYTCPYQKGEEALIDCLLLAHCNILLFPAASAFSMLSLKFNPNMAAMPLNG